MMARFTGGTAEGRARVISEEPIGRMGRPEEIANAVLWLLLHSTRELNETAYLLGYEDANSFFRAFHDWEGTTPGHWRAIQKELAADNTVTRTRSVSKHRAGW
jgi:hypothetical protein